MENRRIKRWAVVFSLLYLMSSVSVGEETVDEKSDDRLKVWCLDETRQPVAGAEVYLFQHHSRTNRYVQFGPFKSNASGGAQTVPPITEKETGNFDRWVYARVPGKLVGAARDTCFYADPRHKDGLKVILYPSTTLKGSVNVPQGISPADVKVIVRSMHIIYGDDLFQYDTVTREPHFPGLDESVPELFEAQPSADGQFEFHDVPAKGRVSLVTRGKNLAEAQWMSTNGIVTGPAKLDVQMEGTVTGRVVSPDGQPVFKARVVGRLSSGGRIRMSYLSTHETYTNEDGTFELRGLPASEFVLSVQDADDKWVFNPIEDIIVDPGATKDFQLQMKSPIFVRGRVINEDGQPVAGANFSALADSKQSPPLVDNESSNKEGRYEFRLPPGKAKFYFNSLPDGYAYPDPQIVKQIELTVGQGDVTFDDIVLQRQDQSSEDR